MPEPDVAVRVTTPRISVRRPVAPTFVNGRLTDEICPLVMVKGVAAPIIAPLALTKEILPVQDAAVPLEDAVAVFTTFSCAVSKLPSPTGGELNDRVVVEDVVCAKAPEPVRAASATVVDRNRFRSMHYLSLVLAMKAATPKWEPLPHAYRDGPPSPAVSRRQASFTFLIQT
jgi:hypothetical protein